MFNLYDLIRLRLIGKMIVVYLWFDYWTLKICKNAESFCLRILAIYTNDWSAFWHVYCSHVYFLCVRFLNVCNLRTTFYLLWWADPPGLAFYGKGIEWLLSWLGAVNAGRLGSMQSKSFLENEIYHFSRLSHEISCLFTLAAVSI